MRAKSRSNRTSVPLSPFPKACQLTGCVAPIKKASVPVFLASLITQTPKIYRAICVSRSAPFSCAWNVACTLLTKISSTKSHNLLKKKVTVKAKVTIANEY